MRKSIGLVLLALCILTGGNAHGAGTTKITNLRVTGTYVVDGATTHNGAVTNSTTTFTGGFIPYPRTLAQINTLTPTTTGQWVGCSDCTRTAVCVSSGSDTGRIGAFVVPIATGTFVGATYSGLPHCQ